MFEIEKIGTSTFLTLGLSNIDEIDSLGYGMLKNNDLNGVIRFDKLSVEGDDLLRYDVTNYKNIVEFIKEEVNSREIAQVIKLCIEAVLEADNYLLDSEKFSFHPERVFISRIDQTPGLIYLPLKNLHSDQHDVFTLTKFIINNAHFSENENGSCIGTLLNYMNSSSDKSLIGYLDALKKITGDQGLTSTGSLSKQYTQARLIRALSRENIDITKDDFLIGNDAESCDYSCLSNRAISRQHAAIQLENGIYHIIDNNSTNKTHLNGEELKPKQKYALKFGDVVSIANEKFMFECF